MQINNHLLNRSIPATDTPLELKQGEIYSAQIKERVSDTEAVIQIRGKEITARFDGAVPTGDRVAVQITGQQNQTVTLKTIESEVTTTRSPQSNEAKVFQSLGLSENDSLELKQAVKILFEKGAPLSKEVVNELKTFFDKADGTPEAKVDTVRALANKKLEVTQTHLRAVHEALNGKPLNEVLTSIAKEIDPNFEIKPVETSRVQTTNSQPSATPIETKQDETINKSVVSKENQLSNLVATVRKAIENEPDLQKAIAKVKEEIVNNPKIDRELAGKIEKVSLEAEKLQTIGKERLVQALKTAEEQLVKKEQQVSQPLPSAETKIAPTSENRTPSEVLKSLKEEVVGSPNLQKSLDKVYAELSKMTELPKETIAKVEKALQEARDLLRQGRVTAGKEVLSKVLAEVEVEANKPGFSNKPAIEVVKQVKEAVQQESKLQNAVDQVREQVVNNPKVDREVAQKIEKAVQEVIQLQQQGKEAAGRERLVQALVQAEVELNEVETKAQRTQPEPRPSEAVKQVKEVVQQEPKLQKAVEQVRDQIINNPKIDREIAQKIEKAVQEAVQLQQQGKEAAGRERLAHALSQAEVELNEVETKAQRTQPESRPSEAVKQVKEVVQQEPKLQKAVEQVRDQIINNPKIDREFVQKIEKAVQEATQLQRQGKEAVGRERLVQALAQAEVELNEVETKVHRNQNEPRPSEVVKQVKEVVQQEPKLQKAAEQVRDQIINNPKIDREVAQKIERAVQEAVQLQQQGKEAVGRERLVQALAQAEVELNEAETKAPRTQTELRPSEVVKQVREVVQQEPKLQKAVEQVREQIVNNPKVDREVAQKIEKAVQEAVQLQQQGKENAIRERLVQALSQAEVELSEAETKVQSTQTEPRPNEVVKQVKEAVQQEPKLQKAVEQVRDQIVNNPKVDREVAQKIERAVQEAIQLQQQGKELAGRERLVQALNQAEVELDSSRKGKQQSSENVTQGNNKTSEVNTSPKEAIKQLREQIQQEPSIKKVMQKVQEQLLNNKTMDSETIKNLNRLANQADQLDQAGRERLVKMLQQVELELKITEIKQTKVPDVQTTNQGTNSLNSQTQQPSNNSNMEEMSPIQAKPSETIKQALKMFQSEPNLEEALNLVRKEVSSNLNINLNHLSRAEEAINHAQQLKDKGREIAARQHINKELTELEQTLKSTEPQINSLQKADNGAQYDLNELLQPLQLQSKDILVTKVTQRLANATNEFSELKRDISRNLDSVQRLIDTYKKNAFPQAKQMLETTISKLDNAILKSDMMLFTDMRTEKQLLQASSQLADAKKLLAKGEFSEASKLVGQVKELIDKIIYKPTEQKIMHFVGKESLAMEGRSTSQQLLGQFEQAARGFVQQEPSARSMFEAVRSMGLNHDSELANSLVFKNGDQSQQEQNQQHQQNLKAILMKLQGEEAGTRVAQQAEQALNNLTGQQLLSKSDSSGTMQSMLLNLPMMLGGKPENIQVYVNSKNEGQQVDWENCSLYFLLETKRLGDVGIMLSSTDRNLSITIKNDKPGFKEKMEPIAGLAKEKLKEVGYNVGSINFTRMTPINSVPANETQPTNESKPQRPVFTEKGMDFKI
ncbi:hypothetical protein SM124_09315 [Bacillus sp. 31A1R]|uniref:Flagellar hook-length control protein-like C-terminal domain-containing protein n=1 Tax=Robertmurraya mangrovi TaxID=3098077 RepID=A0ABU5IXR8_9BACI|nr:hypothetical protein [Bacillus sp. 31A1R]MDZ5471945.1 hypothetical protein [Bacillus sp. 31A1R]